MPDLIEYDDAGGSVVPYHPLANPLPSSSPATVDQGFYDTLPAGVDQQGFDVFMNDVGNLYASDMQKLGMPANFIVDAYDWYRQHALDTQGESPRHHYSLRGLNIPKAELPQVHAFCNYAASIGMPENHVKNSIWFIYRLAEVLQQQQPPQSQSRSAGQEFTDAEWAYIEKRAPRDEQVCADTLRAAWGREAPARMRLVRQYVANLPEAERDYLETTVCKGGLLLGNDPNTVAKLYAAAINGSNAPRGADLQAEIASIEAVMVNDRRRYNNDEALQARLRYLYKLRGS